MNVMRSMRCTLSELSIEVHVLIFGSLVAAMVVGGMRRFTVSEIILLESGSIEAVRVHRR